MPALLLEIGLEEIPAGMIAPAQAELARSVEALLQRERLAGNALQITSYSTPRRLAVLAEDLLPAQPDVEEDVIGPSAKVAYREGSPTAAAIAFAKKNGVAVEALRTVSTTKGEYVGATVKRTGRAASEVLADLLPAAIGSISWPRNMYWRPGKPERFVRPVRWLLALLGQQVLPVEFAGVTADRISYGHRVLHGDAPVVIARPQEYADKLAAAFVQVDPDARRQFIRKALDAAARQIPGARWREDESLVETVTNLTEWPGVLSGSFDASYLSLPEEVLVTVMRDHQKYFALEDADRKLLPNFLAVLNVAVDEAGAAIIRHGNERVLRARFNDARFFWDMDQKIPLADRVEMLKNVTFQKDLGSYWDKTQANLRLAKSLNRRLGTTIDNSDLEAAVSLAKTDLTTEMVKEFTELQGVVGGLYARAQGLPASVAEAIYEQYRPEGASDRIPGSELGCILALADKMAQITSMFRKGMAPTGSRDPFALRRAGLGVIRILTESDKVRSRLHLQTVIDESLIDSDWEDDRLRLELNSFMLDRLEFFLQEALQVRLQVARAVRNAGVAATRERYQEDLVGYGYIADFARALNENVGSPEVISVAALLKRTANILRQAREKEIVIPDNYSVSSHTEPAETKLFARVTEVERTIQKSYREGRHEEVISAIASLQQPLNDFFDSVMVMVDDVRLRDNRLALLAQTESVVRWAADFSELASLQAG